MKVWKCEYCGGNKGMYYKDKQLEGMLCLEPDCGRFNNIPIEDKNYYDSDL